MAATFSNSKCNQSGGNAVKNGESDSSATKIKSCIDDESKNDLQENALSEVSNSNRISPKILQNDTIDMDSDSLSMNLSDISHGAGVGQTGKYINAMKSSDVSHGVGVEQTNAISMISDKEIASPSYEQEEHNVVSVASLSRNVTNTEVSSKKNKTNDVMSTGRNNISGSASIALLECDHPNIKGSATGNVNLEDGNSAVSIKRKRKSTAPRSIKLSHESETSSINNSDKLSDELFDYEDNNEGVDFEVDMEQRSDEEGFKDCNKIVHQSFASKQDNLQKAINRPQVPYYSGVNNNLYEIDKDHSNAGGRDIENETTMKENIELNGNTTCSDIYYDEGDSGVLDLSCSKPGSSILDKSGSSSLSSYQVDECGALDLSSSGMITSSTSKGSSSLSRSYPTGDLAYSGNKNDIFGDVGHQDLPRLANSCNIQTQSSSAPYQPKQTARFSSYTNVISNSLTTNPNSGHSGPLSENTSKNSLFTTNGESIDEQAESKISPIYSEHDKRREDSSMKDYAESTVHELLNMYGLGEEAKAITEGLPLQNLSTGSILKKWSKSELNSEISKEPQFDTNKKEEATMEAHAVGDEEDEDFNDDTYFKLTGCSTFRSEASSPRSLSPENTSLDSSINAPLKVGAMYSPLKNTSYPDYGKYVKRYASYEDCANSHCLELQYREHFHCVECTYKVFLKKEEMIRHFKWHRKRDESLQHGFMRYSPMDDCGKQFDGCIHNGRQTHYHCLQPGCSKVYVSTSDVQMHSNYHRKDSAIMQLGFQRFRATEDCGTMKCPFYGQRTTHFHCRKSGCHFAFKNKADIEKHKSYHQKDELLTKDGFKKFMKYEVCMFSGCRFSKLANHIHCIRPGCDYILHSTSQLLSHKRKHERREIEFAYRKFKEGSDHHAMLNPSLVQFASKSSSEGQNHSIDPLSPQQYTTRGESALSEYSNQSDCSLHDQDSDQELEESKRFDAVNLSQSVDAISGFRRMNSSEFEPRALDLLSKSMPDQQVLNGSQFRTSKSQNVSPSESLNLSISSSSGKSGGLHSSANNLGSSMNQQQPYKYSPYGEMFRGKTEDNVSPSESLNLSISSSSGKSGGLHSSANNLGSSMNQQQPYKYSPYGEMFRGKTEDDFEDEEDDDYVYNNEHGLKIETKHSHSLSGSSAGMVSPPEINEKKERDESWKTYLTRYTANDPCHSRCEFLYKDHYHCNTPTCDVMFRSKDGVRDHARNHEQLERITALSYMTYEEINSCFAKCPYNGSIKHYHCLWTDCNHVISEKDPVFTRLEHYHIHEYSRSSGGRKTGKYNHLMLKASHDLKRRRGRPPKYPKIDIPVVPKIEMTEKEIMDETERLGSSHPIAFGYIRFLAGQQCPDDKCIHFVKEHYHCVRQRCHHSTDNKDVVSLHAKEFHWHITIYEGFEFFDRTINCRRPHCHNNKANRHFHCVRPKCDYSFVRYSTMAQHDKKHKMAEMGLTPHPMIGVPSVHIQNPERYLQENFVPNGNTPWIKDKIVIENGADMSFVASTKVSPTLSQQFDTTHSKIIEETSTTKARLIAPKPAHSINVASSKVAPMVIKLTPNTAMSSLSSSTNVGVVFSNSQISTPSAMSSTGPPIIVQPVTVQDVNSSIGDSNQSIPNNLPSLTNRMNIRQTLGNRNPAIVNQQQQQQQTPSISSETMPLAGLLRKGSSVITPQINWKTLLDKQHFSPIQNCNRPFCKLKKKDHYHCFDCNQAFTDPERLRSHMWKHGIKFFDSNNIDYGDYNRPSSYLIQHQQETTDLKQKDIRSGRIEINTVRPKEFLDGNGTKKGMIASFQYGNDRDAANDGDDELDVSSSLNLNPLAFTTMLQKSQKQALEPRYEDSDDRYKFYHNEQGMKSKVDGEQHNSNLVMDLPHVGVLDDIPMLSMRKDSQGFKTSFKGNQIISSQGQLRRGILRQSRDEDLSDTDSLPEQDDYNQAANEYLSQSRNTCISPNEIYRDSSNFDMSHSARKRSAEIDHELIDSDDDVFPADMKIPKSSRNVINANDSGNNNNSKVYNPKMNKKSSASSNIQDMNFTGIFDNLPDGYEKFHNKMECPMSHCTYKKQQTHYHCMRPECNFGTTDRSRLLQHSERHRKTDDVLGDEFTQYRGNVTCNRPDCENSGNGTHYHCMKCPFICTDMSKVMAHRKHHNKMEAIEAQGFTKVTGSEDCGYDQCHHKEKQTHYHCIQGDCVFVATGPQQIQLHNKANHPTQVY